MKTPTPTEPAIAERAERPYLGIRRSVTMETMDRIADRIPELISHLNASGLELAGPPFLRYHVIDMERQLVVEAGVPLEAPAPGAGEIQPGLLPAGRYVTVTHVGNPGHLVYVVTALLRWVAERGLRWDMAPSPEGDRWGCRLEIFQTNPAVEPDMSKWETELAFRLAD